MKRHPLKAISRGMLRHHPSPATVISIVALFIAASGTAYAATGGTFILGKSNSATSVSSLSNSAGTALSLSSKAGKPPLAVNSTVQVPKLNASLLGGNAPSSFVQGAGKVATGTLTLQGQTTGFIVGTYPDEAFYLDGSCDPGGSPDADISFSYGSSSPVYLNWEGTNGNGTNYNFAAGNGNTTVLSGGLNGGLVTVQVHTGARVITFTASVYMDTNTFPDTCIFSGQVFSNQ